VFKGARMSRRGPKGRGAPSASAAAGADDLRSDDISEAGFSERRKPRLRFLFRHAGVGPWFLSTDWFPATMIGRPERRVVVDDASPPASSYGERDHHGKAPLSREHDGGSRT